MASINLRYTKYFCRSFQVRHPNILSFLHSTEVETSDGSSTKITIYIVTEPVMPLSEKIKELKLEGTQRYIQVIHSILMTYRYWCLPLLYFSDID